MDGDGNEKFGEGGAERDPMEEELLTQLEDLAQKADVLTHWADEMYEFVKAIPVSESPPVIQSLLGITPILRTVA